MTETYLAHLLSKAMPTIASYSAKLAEEYAAYAKAKAVANDRDKQGRLTPEANQARQMLGNPQGKTTHKNKARAVAERHAREAEKRADLLTGEALTARIVADYAQQELKLFDLEESAADKEEAVANREEHGQQQIDRYGRPLINAMIEHGVAPSVLKRRRKFEYQVLADMLTWANDDPKYDDAANPWRILAEHGYMAAYHHGMSEDEARIIEMSRLEWENPEGAELIARCDALSQELNVSPQFAAGVAKIFACASDYLDGDLRALVDAQDLMFANDERVVAAILDLSPDQIDIIRPILAGIRGYANRSSHEALKWDAALMTFTTRFEAVDPIGDHPAVWFDELLDELNNLSRAFANRIDGPEVFWTLVHEAGKLSRAYQNAEAFRENEQELRYRELIYDSIRTIESMGLSYKLDNYGWPVPEDDKRFETLDSEIITPAEYSFFPQPKGVDAVRCDEKSVQNEYRQISAADPSSMPNGTNALILYTEPPDLSAHGDTRTCPDMSDGVSADEVEATALPRGPSKPTSSSLSSFSPTDFPSDEDY